MGIHLHVGISPRNGGIMMANPNTQSNTQPAEHKTESKMKHIISFAVMIVLTIAAFALVLQDIVPAAWVLPLMLVFAVIQVLLQLFTFMHLDQKGTLYYVIFIFCGIVVAIISALGLILMP